MKIFNNSIEITIDNTLQLVADNLTVLPITIAVEIEEVSTNNMVLNNPNLNIPAIGNPPTLIDNLTNYAFGQYVVKFTLNGDSEYGTFIIGGLIAPTISPLGNIVAVISGRSQTSNGEHETTASDFNTNRVRQEFYNKTTAETVKTEYFDPTSPNAHIVSLDDSVFTAGEYEVLYFDDIGDEEIFILNDSGTSFPIPNTL